MTTAITLTPGNGPEFAPSSRPGVGLFHRECLRYDAPGSRPAAAVIETVDEVIADGMTLSYGVFCPFDADAGSVESGSASTAIVVDLRLDDGSLASSYGLRDHHGVRLTAADQFGSKTMITDQWNFKIIDLAPIAGRRVVAIEVQTDPPGIDGLPELITGWLDGVTLSTVTPPGRGADKPTDYVITTRGTHASSGFSRGNNAPLTAVPHGFNFVTPITNARDHRWIYAWHQHNDEDNRPALQGLAISHIPSPWIGDRSIFQVCPTSAPGVPDADPQARALTFDHGDETARAQYYGVTTSSGMKLETAPTDHAVIMRFTFPGDDAALIFDSVAGAGGLEFGTDPRTGRSVISGYVDDGWIRGVIYQRMFVYGVLDRPVIDSGHDGGVRGYVRLDAGADRTVVLRLATSFISVAQAERNLDQELAADESLESVRDQAEAQWLQRLGKITIAGGSVDQLTTLYSGLYRLFLYPNSMTENAGTLEEPDHRYASSFQQPKEHTPTETGCAVVAGKCVVNNGFWDTYRTCWPALNLLDPSRAGELLDGFVQHYRDGGWTARWSAPGYVDCMVGTSSDIVLADAAVKRIPGVDYASGYDSAVRNATVPSPDPITGRNGLETSIFRGYVSASTSEGMSWTMEGAINDYGLAVWSELLAAEDDHGRADEYAANARYFRSRAAAYSAVFDRTIGFFQGRTDDGGFRMPAEEFEPGIWGNDYTETNAWGMAFSAPHDGAGLAALYGGKRALEEKLDEFFTTEETATQAMAGSYGRPIHEMTEARSVRMGMLGLSNQPAHHIPYMYLHAGVPHKAQAIVRDCLNRLFLGSEIGQGYLGDEDNGEMSAWYLFSALGLYPLSLGSGEYVLNTPLFERASINLDSGGDLTIIRHAEHPDQVYIQSVKINNEPWPHTTVPHELVARGATIEFFLGDEPSDWGTEVDHAPLCLTPDGQQPAALADLTTPSGKATSSDGDAKRAFDDSSATALELTAGGWVRYQLDQDAEPSLYTVTSSGLEPRGWILEGSADGVAWQLADQRDAEVFQWDRQTRPFIPQHPAAYSFFRLRVHPASTLPLYQLELLADA